MHEQNGREKGVSILHLRSYIHSSGSYLDHAPLSFKRNMTDMFRSHDYEIPRRQNKNTRTAS